MEKFWILILVAFFVTNSLDKAESVEELEELPLQTFDELCVEECLDKLNSMQLISLHKLNQIRLIRILLSQSLITLIMPKMVKNE
uniref:Uncharacterized protein n=1 Tax=Globodera rostochiensis TaxID=31243 RepID=A0A914GSL1_GLORO